MPTSVRLALLLAGALLLVPIPASADGQTYMKTMLHREEDKVWLEGKTWTSERRAEQVRRLQAAFPLERRAIREIEKALAAMENVR